MSSFGYALRYSLNPSSDLGQVYDSKAQFRFDMPIVCAREGHVFQHTSFLCCAVEGPPAILTGQACQ